ncbi:polysaccharide pyruvyl transferase family protein [Cellulomonas sp. NPDC055163]
MRIGLTNAVLSNGGDAAIADAIVGALVDAGLCSVDDVVVFDADARASAALYPGLRILQQVSVSPPRRPGRLHTVLQRLRSRAVHVLASDLGRARRVLRSWPLRRTAFSRSFEALLGCDVVLSSGGTYLVDHYDFAPRSVELGIARRSADLVVLWTQSMGPFESDRARAAIRSIVPSVDAVYLRDERSAASWERTGSTVPAAVVPDAVFGLEPLPGPGAPAPGSGPRRRALISVRQWARSIEGDELVAGAYGRAVRGAAEALLARGWEVSAMSTCQGVPRYPHDDSKVAARIFAGSGVVVDSGFHTPTQLRRELRDVDLVVATRMHLAILALIERRPVIAIAYEFKTLELFHGLGLGEWVVPMSDVSAEWLVDRATRLEQDPGAAVLSETVLADLRRRAMSPAHDLRRRTAVAAGDGRVP